MEKSGTSEAVGHNKNVTESVSGTWENLYAGHIDDDIVCDLGSGKHDQLDEVKCTDKDSESEDTDSETEDRNSPKPTLLQLAQSAGKTSLSDSKLDSTRINADRTFSKLRRDDPLYLSARDASREQRLPSEPRYLYPRPPSPPGKSKPYVDTRARRSDNLSTDQSTSMGDIHHPRPTNLSAPNTPSPFPVPGKDRRRLLSGPRRDFYTSSPPPPPPPPPPIPEPYRRMRVERSRNLSTDQSTSMGDLHHPRPSTSYDSGSAPDVGRRESLDPDGNLAAIREQVRLLIENMRSYDPLSHFNEPDNMQLEELQSALLDFRYLEQAFLDPEDYYDHLYGFDLDIPHLNDKNMEPAFARGLEVKAECQICLDEVNLYRRICCDFPVCDPCMEQYVETNVNQGVVKIVCIGSTCNTFLFRDEILGRLSVPMKDKYYKFLVDANKDPKVKTCPRCSNIHTISDSELENRTKFGLLVVCPECHIEWCFECQAPWHKEIKCKEYRKGDKLVKSWAKETHYGNANAQKCPKCKIFIERKGGCDHMTCSKCDTGFCYKCGGRYMDLKFFGNHLSRFSPLGCKYNFKPNRPFLRRFIRGSVFGAKLLGGLVLVSLGVAAVGVLVGASVVILPAFGAYKYRKHRRFKRRLKRQQELIKMRSKNAMLELHRERPSTCYMLDPRHLREREGLREIIEREESMRQSRRSNRNETVHIGIQTGQSQQVDVTVHNPYSEDALAVNDDTQNSEIRMNITDDRGHVTVTTAEISHNTNAGSEGSEAEIVLHVKTSYPKHEKDSKNSTDVAGTTAIDQPDVTKLDTGTKTDIKDSSSLSKPPLDLESRPKSAQVHRRAHSTGSVRKNVKKQEFGSISRKWKLKALAGRKTSDGNLPDQNMLNNNGDEPVNTDFPEDKGKGAPIEADDNSETDNLVQSGCFLKLLGKKLNTYQNQSEKDKQHVAKSDSNIGDMSNCPDVVSCALQAELKSKEAMKLDNHIHGNEKKAVEKDDYFGIISQESDSTAL